MLDHNETVRLKYLAGVIQDLNSVWKPHPGQVPIGRALFTDGKKEVILECGRKAGKTDFICYALYRWALTNPGTFNYYFAPFKDQINDLVWKNGRMPNFLPEHLQKKYIESINNTDQRIFFKNKSFIKCDGSDNHVKARGYSATGLSAYDETKDFRKEFHTGFDPNRAITDTPLLAVGSPEGSDNLLSQLWDAASLSKTGAAFRMPSHINPHISAEYLEKKRLEHIARDEYELYEQEYLAKRVKLGTKFIFPMLSQEIVEPYENMMAHLTKFRKDYDFFVSADPGSAKCFAVLFGAIHRYDKHVMIIDEIYEPKMGQNSVGVMAPRILEKINEINRNHDDWMACYDHAAAWFFSELTATMPDFPINFIKCEKDLNNKEKKLSMIKDMILTKVFTMSNRCVKLYWEMENYKRKDGGLIEKINDHCFVGETLVRTIGGDRQIQHIKRGDLVLTRFGYRVVTKIWDNGEKEIYKLKISNGIELHLTLGHKIYTLNRGFVKVEDLTMEDVLCTDNVLKLSLMDKLINYGLSLKIKVLRLILGVLKEI